MSGPPVVESRQRVSDTSGVEISGETAMIGGISPASMRLSRRLAKEVPDSQSADAPGVPWSR